MKHWNSKLLEQLLQVQDTDLKIRKLDLQIQVFHQRSKEEDSELSRIKAEIARIDEALVATESQNQMYSTTLEDIRSAIKGLLTTKAGAPKPRTRSSTEALKIEEEKLESLLEETGEQLIRLKESRESLLGKADNRTEELESDHEGPEAEIRKLQQQIRRFEKQREEEIQGIPQLLLKHYDRLRSSRSGVGLTTLKDGVCTVCCMTMPTAIASKLSHGEKIPMCPACGRMVARIEHTAISVSDSDGADDGSLKKPKKEKKSLLTLRETADERKAALKKTLKRSMEKKMSGIDSGYDDDDIMVPISDAALPKREVKTKKSDPVNKKKEVIVEEPAPTVEKVHPKTAETEKTDLKPSSKKTKMTIPAEKAEKPVLSAKKSGKPTTEAAPVVESKPSKKQPQKPVLTPTKTAEKKSTKKKSTDKKSEKEIETKKRVSKLPEKKVADSKTEPKKKAKKTTPKKAAAASKAAVKKQPPSSKKTSKIKVPPPKKSTKKSEQPKSAAKKSGKSKSKK
jgi:predicted  nucleic acid-binding Zn-ribbon protein